MGSAKITNSFLKVKCNYYNPTQSYQPGFLNQATTASALTKFRLPSSTVNPLLTFPKERLWTFELCSTRTGEEDFKNVKKK